MLQITEEARDEIIGGLNRIPLAGIQSRDRNNIVDFLANLKKVGDCGCAVQPEVVKDIQPEVKDEKVKDDKVKSK